MKQAKTNSNKNIMDQVYERLRRAGTAVGRLNGNNTHSGNLSMRDPQDDDIFYITATGSQCDALIPRDIVPVRRSGVSWGDARGSTESTIHRRIFAVPGTGAVLHAHFLESTFISFDTKEKQLFLKFLDTDHKGREEFLFQPVDIHGAFAVGGVRVGSYEQPVGSAEMEERIPQYLEKDKLTIVRGHGPFCRAGSIEEALHLMCVLENSAKLALFLRRRGFDFSRIRDIILQKGPDRVFPSAPQRFRDIDFSECRVGDETVIADFRQRLNYNYNNFIGAFGTGSMSQKISSQEMIYCPVSAVPEDFEFPLLRAKLPFRDDDSLDLRIHKLIYRHTHQNACMITSSPLAAAEGMAVLAEQYGEEVLTDSTTQIPYTARQHPFIHPIDAEAIYLNPKLGLVDIYRLVDETETNPILDMLRWYKGCCVVAGYGVISTGATTLEKAAHNAASAERIARFRSEVYYNHKLLDGPPVRHFEPQS